MTSAGLRRSRAFRSASFAGTRQDVLVSASSSRAANLESTFCPMRHRLPASDEEDGSPFVAYSAPRQSNRRSPIAQRQTPLPTDVCPPKTSVSNGVYPTARSSHPSNATRGGEKRELLAAPRLGGYVGLRPSASRRYSTGASSLASASAGASVPAAFCSLSVRRAL